MTKQKNQPTVDQQARDERLCAIEECTRKRWGDDPLCRRHLSELEQAMSAPEPIPTAPVE